MKKDYKCKTCQAEFVALTDWKFPMCPYCWSLNTKRIWCTNVSMNGNGYKNGFQGKKKFWSEK